MSDSYRHRRAFLASTKENIHSYAENNLCRNMKDQTRSKTNGLTKVFELDNIGWIDPRKQQQEEITQMSLRIHKLEQAIAELTNNDSMDSSVAVASRKTTPGNISVQLHNMDGLKTDSLHYFLLDEEDMQDDAFHYSIAHLQNSLNMEFDRYSDIPKDYTEADEVTSVPLRTNNDPQPKKQEDPSTQSCPPHIFFRSLQFPCPPEGQGLPDMDGFIEFLPSYERACVLLDNYLNYFSWSTLIIAVEDLYSLIRYFYPFQEKIEHLKVQDSRRLSLLFLVCLFGTIFDFELDPKTVISQTEMLHIMARASLASYPVSVETTAETIQSLTLMLSFYRMYPGGTSAMQRWVLSGALLKLIQGIGLDRNSREYLTDDEKCAYFERVFWEYNAGDIWQSFALGRSTTVILTSETPYIPTNVKPLAPFRSQYYIWRYKFSELLARFTTLGIERSATYSDVMAFERQIRDFHIPSSLEWHNIQVDNELCGNVLQSFSLAISKHLAILYLHRPYFWHATSKKCSPRNSLLLSHSVAMVYDSASIIVTLTQDVWRMHPRVVGRMAIIWEPCQTATLMLGVLVIRNPTGPFAKTAFRKMEDACDMLSSINEIFFPKHDMQTLLTLRMKMRESFKNSHE